MNAGRELDALIAEKVMGWQAVEIGFGNHAGKRVWVHPEHKPALGSGSDQPELYAPLPNYSTDIAAAWDVVERLRRMPQYGIASAQIDFSIEQKNRLEGGKWCVQTDRINPDHNGHYFKVWQFADTAPLAICLAALQAVE